MKKTRLRRLRGILAATLSLALVMTPLTVGAEETNPATASEEAEEEVTLSEEAIAQLAEKAAEKNAESVKIDAESAFARLEELGIDAENIELSLGDDTASGETTDATQDNETTDATQDNTTTSPNNGTTSPNNGTASPNNEAISNNNSVTNNNPTSNNENAPKDGYTEIKMKAAVQKNNTIKIAWNAPKGAKKYKLYQRVAEGFYTSESDAWYEIPSTEYKGTAKSYTDKKFKESTETTKYLDVYKLIAYDKDGEEIGTYITAAAPLMFYVENGVATDTFDFYFSEMMSESSISYALQTAAQNKEKTDTKNPNGFQDGWTTTVASTDTYIVDKWPATKSSNISTVVGTYEKQSGQTFTSGTTYYNRVRVVYKDPSTGVEYYSAPSNVISRKDGPDKVMILDITGLKYEKGNTAANKKRANDYIASYGTMVNGEWVDGTPLSQDEFSHLTNTTTDAKNGYVFFWAKNESNIKSYQLLRCNTALGTYKSVKTYSATQETADFWKVTLPEGSIFEVEGYSVYCIHYTNFPPESTYYYAVRAVATNKAVGGYGVGLGNTTIMDQVQGTVILDATPSQLNVYWNHDDCVKQYWVYRSKNPASDYAETYIDDDGNETVADETKLNPLDLNNYKKLGTVKGTKTTTITYEDEEGNKQTEVYNRYTDKKVPKLETEYLYIIKPVYNTKSAKKLDYNLELCSSPVAGETTAYGVKVKSLSVSSTALDKIKISWKGVKNIPNYDIYRIATDSSTSAKTYLDSDGAITSAWTKVTSVKKNSTGTITWTDSTSASDLVPCQYYFYGIIPTSENPDGSAGIPTVSNRIRTVPKAVTSVKASFRATGQGARVTWSGNSSDSSAASRVGYTYSYQIKVGDASWRSAKSPYDDTSALTSGSSRTYQVRAIVTNSNGVIQAASSAVSVKFTASSNINLYDSTGTNAINTNPTTINIKKGSRVDLKARLADGTTTNLQVVCTSGANAVAVEQSISGGYLNFAFGGVNVGTQTFEVRSGNSVARKITVNVVN